MEKYKFATMMESCIIDSPIAAHFQCNLCGAVYVCKMIVLSGGAGIISIGRENNLVSLFY